ncbi:MAG: GAF domain-containing protein [Syntrophobacteraceae bacterium]
MAEHKGSGRVKPYRAHHLVVVFCLLAAGIGAAGYLYYQGQKSAIEKGKHDELSAIAKLKVNQISEWRHERVEDAFVYGSNAIFAEAVHKWLKGPKETLTEQKILKWMLSVQVHHGYAAVLLADGTGAIRLATNGADRTDGFLDGSLPRVIQGGVPVLSDLYRADDGEDIRICLFAPIPDPGGGGAPVVAILLLLIDPNEYLYPLIQSWPTPSLSSETLLAHRKGDSVVFLNTLKYQNDTALSLRYPVSSELLPAARGARNERGIVTGVDYRGVSVLAALESIPDSTWFLVAKVDSSEVYSPIRERAIWVAVAVAMMIGSAAVCLALIWNRQRKEALEQARDELETRVEERTQELVETNAMLKREILDRIRTEEALKLDEARLAALLELTEITQVSTTRQISDLVLDHAIRLTGSRMGSLGFLDDEGERFTSIASSECGGEQCKSIDQPVWPITNDGGCSEIARQREPVILNDELDRTRHEGASSPGAMPVRRFMSVPVVSEDRVAALVVVANKESPYDTSDVRQLALLMDGMWKVLERERAEKALKAAENLAAMGRALSSVAHDIKTPLIAIGGFTRLVQRHLPEESADREKLEIVLKETERLESMIKDMLDFSKPLDLNLSPVSITGVVDECLALVAPLAQEREILVQSRSSEDLLEAPIDSMRMKQVIINLVMNAIQASPPRKAVTVHTHRVKGSVLIDVTDCGCGIPVENRETVFTPFFSTKKDGTGLGLAIVRKIVEAHKGRVEMLDNPEGGITFRVAVPIASAHQADSC